MACLSAVLRDKVADELAFSPRTWGWSALEYMSQSLGRFLPAHVGMVLCD